MSVGDNRDRGLDVEDLAAERYPARPAFDDRKERNAWFDLEFTGPVVQDDGAVLVDEETVAEVKSCFTDYTDGGGARAGRWKILRHNHDPLLSVDGVYVLAVVERETCDVLRMAIVDATVVDGLIDGDWWVASNGRGRVEEYRQIPWTELFDELGGPIGRVDDE